MSQEVQPQKSSFGSTVAGYAAFPAFSTACIATSALKHGKSIKGAVKNMNIDGYKAINESLKNSGVDVFTRSEALALGHETYKGFVKNDAKLAKKLAKLDKRGLPLKEKFFNLFRKNKKTVADLETKYLNAYKDAPENLANAKKAIKEAGENFSEKTAKNLDDVLKVDGKKFGKIAQETAESATKTGVKGFGKYVKNNFKRELSWKHGKFNIIMTALQFIPNVINDVIPTFKEKGFKEGMKSVGKTLVKAGTDLVSYAAGGALGRAIGAAIGTVICPGAGSAVGATVGDMIGSMIVGGTATAKMEKALDGDKKEKVTQEQIAQASTETNQASTEVNQASTDVQNNAIQNDNVQDISQTEIAQNNEAIIQNEPKTFEEAKANVTNSIDEKPKSRYIKPQNGVYHTAWVNDLNKQKMQQQEAQQGLNYQA